MMRAQWLRAFFLAIATIPAVLAQGAFTRVTYVTPSSAYIDAGREEGIEVGDLVEVMRKGELVAVLRVTSVSSHKAVCARTLRDIAIEVGDEVRYGRLIEDVPSDETPPPSPPAEMPQLPPLSQPPEAAPAAAPRRPLRDWGLRGRIGLRYFMSRARDGEGRDYEQPALDLRLTGTDVGGSGFDLGLDVRARRTFRTASDGADDSENLTRVYNAFAAWSPPQGLYRVSAGRQYSPSLSVVSVFDGVAGEYRRERFAVGAFTGSQPDAEDYGFDTSVREHGAYVEFGGARDGEARWAVTTGAIASYEEGEINREFLFVQGRYDHPRFSVYAVQEIDYNRGWRAEAEDGTFAWTSFYGYLRYRLTDSIDLRGGYDSRRNARLYRDLVSPETDFDDRYRRGAWAGVDARVGRHWLLGGEVRRSELESEDPADAASLFVGVRRLTAWDLGFRVRSTRYENAATRGWLHSVTASAQVTERIGVSVQGGAREESARTSVAFDQDGVRWYGIDVDVLIAPRWLFLGSLERTTGGGEEADRLFATISYRF